MLAIFTGVLALAGWITWRQIRRTRQAIERPQLRVKAFRLTRGRPASDRQQVGLVESLLQGLVVVEFTVENVGKRTAHLLRSSVGTEFPTRVRLPDDPSRLPDLPYRGFNVTGSRELEPGASTSYEITCEAGAPGVDALMVCGRLEYAGGTTGFCRVWDPTHNHFVAVGGPDYEYED
jgi:hypothetical protein